MSGYEWRLSVKYDPDQPREPAGSPEGGRWTVASAAGAPGLTTMDRARKIVREKAVTVRRGGMDVRPLSESEAEDLARVLSRHPQAALDKVEEIAWAKDAESFAAAGESLGIGSRDELLGEYGGAVASYAVGLGGLEGAVTILLSDLRPEFVDHEMGHVIWQSLPRDRRSTYERFWNSGKDWGKPTDYASISPEESFAEVYMSWLASGYAVPPSVHNSKDRRLIRMIGRPMDFVEEAIRGL